jgi:hypothetical protein
VSDFTDAISAIRSASDLTEATFLQIGQALESSAGILAKLTSSFEAVLTELTGEHLGQALRALSETAARVKVLGRNQSGESARLEQMRCLIGSIGERITRMKTSLKDVESLAVNSKIAAAAIRAPGTDFTTFADDVGRTLDVTRTTFDRLGAELDILRQQVTAAHSGHVSFETHRHEAAHSIMERLSETVKSLALQHQRAARASLEVRLGSARIHQRTCNAILALQIGDATRQRLEHADHALELVAATRGQRDPVEGHPALDEDEQWSFIMAAHRLQSAQLSDAARNFGREVANITEALNSLAAEAQALPTLGDAAYGATDRRGGTFLAELEAQVGEALALLEGFQSARAEVASVMKSVSDASASLCGHLRTVQSLESDIRIMGLNTTLKCARVGRDGLALGIIAQELRSYANGFAKDAGTLMREIQNLANITGSLAGVTEAEQSHLILDGTQAMQDSLATLRRMGQSLDVALVDLRRDSDSVVAVLVVSIGDFAAQNEIESVLRGVAGHLAELLPAGFLNLTNLTPGVEQMLELMASVYTMANERMLHDRILGRTSQSAVVPETAPGSELEDFLF